MENNVILKLAEYKEYGIILALVILIAWLIKIFFEKLSKIDDKHYETYCKLADTIKENTDVTKEMSLYLKLRNGNDTKKILELVEKYHQKL